MVTAQEWYDSNIAFMSEKTPGLEEGLANYPLANVQLFPNAAGQIVGRSWSTAHQAWVPLCNLDDPLQEAEVDAETWYTTNIKVFCLIGFGLGYFAQALARRLLPYQRLVIYDLDPNMYKAALYAIDFRALMDNKRVDLFVGSDVLAQVEPWWLGLETFEKLHIAGPMRAGYTNVVMKIEYDAVLNKVVDMLRFHAVGLSTWRIFGAAIGNNDLANLPDYFQYPGFESLKDLWKGKPAVCIAAGPSLHKNLHSLLDPDIRKNLFLIAVGTVYGLLRSLHIKPDIVTTIDFQRLNWTDQFHHIPLDATIPLVYLHSTYPQTPRRWPGPCFVGENASDTVNWLHQYTPAKRSAALVQTVAHLNVLVALEIGADPIVLLGQDLSMPIAHHHADGARAQDQSPQEARAEAFVTVPDFEGKPVHTRHSFLSMLTVFERLARENPDRQLFNCSEAGLAIPGIPAVPFATFLRTVPARASEELWEANQRMAWLAGHYEPVLNEALYTDFQTLCDEVELLIGTSRRVVGFAKEMGLETESLCTWVLNKEAAIQTHRAAFGLFAIRHFGLIELMAEIPPDSAILSSSLLQQRYNAERIVRVCTMIGEEGEHVRLLLRRTQMRLCGHRDDMLALKEGQITVSSVMRALAQQRYKDAQRLLDHVQDATAAEVKLLQRKIFWHQQQYPQARALGLEVPGFRLQRLAERFVKASLQPLRRYASQQEEHARSAPAALGPVNIFY